MIFISFIKKKGLQRQKPQKSLLLKLRQKSYSAAVKVVYLLRKDLFPIGIARPNERFIAD